MSRLYLMLPGFVVDGPVTPYSLGDLKKGVPCSVKLIGNRSPVAVGITARSTYDMYSANMKGKGVNILHTFQDQLWAFGDKSSPPVLEDSEFLSAAAGEDDDSDDDDDDDDADGDVEDKPTEATADDDGSLEEAATPETEVAGAMEELKIQDETSEEEEEEEEEEEDPQGAMDELIRWCFLSTLKLKVKPKDLPMLTSTFYAVHMLSCCPKDKTVDVKKSSYKKVSKFLQAMVQEDFITMKQLTKDVDSITTINKDCRELRAFKVDPSELPDPEEDQEPGEGATQMPYSPPQIREVYLVTANTLPFCKPAGYGKGHALSAQDLRKVLTDYVKTNELQNPNRKGTVILDPLLSDTALNKGEYIEQMKWEDVYTRIVGKCSLGYEITYPNQRPQVKKGKLEPVIFNIANRSGNKKVTLVENLEVYGIEPAVFAQEVQVGVAASASLSPAPGKNRRMQMLVQGNQINYIAQLLTEKYKLQRKWLQGLEKAPKSGKKRR